MSRFRLFVLFVLITFSFSDGSFAQNKTVSPKQSPNPEAEKKALEEREDLLNRLAKARTLVERAKQMKGAGDRTNAIIGLAEAIWKYDREYAEQLLIQTYYNLKNLENAPKGKEPPRLGKPMFETPKYKLSYSVLAVLRRLAPATAKKLARTAENDELLFSDISATENAVKQNQIEQAKRAWESSLQYGLNYGSMIQLLQMREENPEIADALFLHSLNYFARQPAIKGNDLMFLGSYIFTVGNDGFASIGMSSVNRVSVIFMWEERLPFSEVNTRAFLQFAVSALSRQPVPPSERASYFLTAYQLLPHIKTFAPELETVTNLAMQRLLIELPPDFASEQNLRLFGKPAGLDYYNSEKFEKRLEAIYDDGERDFNYLYAAEQNFAKGNLERARFFADKIKDILLAGKLQNVLRYAESIKFLEKKEFVEAEEIARKMNGSLEKAVLWLEIAAIYLKEKNEVALRNALLEAEASLKETDEISIALLKLKTADIYAKIKDISAFSRLSESIKGFNRESGKGLGGLRIWQIEIMSEHGKILKRPPQRFILPKAVRPRISENTDSILAFDADSAESVILDLKNESALAQFLVVLGKFRLSEKPKTPLAN